MGKSLITEDKWSEWDRCVDIRLGDLYKGADLEASLELMTQLSNGVDFADVREWDGFKLTEESAKKFNSLWKQKQ